MVVYSSTQIPPYLLVVHILHYPRMYQHASGAKTEGEGGVRGWSPKDVHTLPLHSLTHTDCATAICSCHDNTVEHKLQVYTFHELEHDIKEKGATVRLHTEHKRCYLTDNASGCA